jgi:tight adherence protein C
MQIVFLGFVFLIVFGVIILATRLFSTSAVQTRLDSLAGKPASVANGAATPWIERIVKLTGPLANLSLPKEGWGNSALRTRFMNAGFRNASAPVTYFTAKTALAIGLPFLTFFFLNMSNAKFGSNALLLWLFLSVAIGYYLPNLLLSNIITRRQREIFETFPDALDLMTVCVEAGLAMDAALARVAAEIGLKSAVLSDELNLVTLELRAGSSKERALRNLALRTGVEDVDALVAMLIQTERFGTSIAASLRVQSEQLRTKRRQRAEETAAKIALKLLFPLIFFIFPSLLVVLMGPAIIQISSVLLPTIGASN